MSKDPILKHHQKTSASEIVDQALKQIAKENNRYRAVIVSGGERVAKAADEIDRLDPEERKKLVLGGVPVLVKDNIETSEWPTTAGSLILARNYTRRDAEIVSNLRQNGAIIIGKTNLSEWANFRSEGSISGWSAIGGQTRNAHDPNRTACGSSSGSAVSVARGYVSIAIGTETDGSIVCPAAMNGVVGFKPTHGILSSSGIIPIASSQDTAGPIASDVTSAALALGGMLGSNDSSDTLRSALINLEKPDDLYGIRVGAIANPLLQHKQLDILLSSALSDFRKIGAEVIGNLSLDKPENIQKEEFSVLMHEFRLEIDHYLGNLPNDLNHLTLKKIVELNREDPVELSFFGQTIFEAALTQNLTPEQYRSKLESIKRVARADGLDHLFDENRLDLIVGISNGPAWIIDQNKGDTFSGPSLSQYPAIGGHPHITVPLGTADELPIGLSFIGRRMDDAKIAAIALAFEALLKQK